VLTAGSTPTVRLDSSGAVLVPDGDAGADGVGGTELAGAELAGAELVGEELLQPALAATHKSAARPASAGRKRRMMILSALN
jgi:hypothetical protein